jgi:nucleotide-binding universal stress UspA family protein
MIFIKKILKENMGSIFPKIMVCLDGSKKSQKALAKGIQISEKFGSQLTLLLVIPEQQIDFWDDTEYRANSEMPQRSLKKNSKIYRQSEKILNDFSKRAPTTIKCVPKILVGDPANTILTYASKQKPSLIILGSRGLGGFSKLLLGSVSSKVSDHAATSVLIVR